MVRLLEVLMTAISLLVGQVVLEVGVARLWVAVVVPEDLAAAVQAVLLLVDLEGAIGTSLRSPLATAPKVLMSRPMAKKFGQPTRMTAPSPSLMSARKRWFKP